jgi:hypothetical protein
MLSHKIFLIINAAVETQKPSIDYLPAGLAKELLIDL